MPVFEFNQQLTPQSLLDLDDIGEFAIEATNDDGYFYYLIARTTLGTTTLATCGPFVPDVGLLPSGYCCRLDRMQFKEDKLSKTISLWLNDKSKKLTDAKIVDIDTAISSFIDLGSYLEHYSEELY